MKCQECKKEGHQTVEEALFKTKEWQAWVEYNEETLDFDVHETMETGWMSDEHMQRFIEFIKNKSNK